ncbi:MAG: ChbG/HpnK family deacetylase [Rhodoferax sp.]|uniref:ChbG/HpnK family deacetylase n=1 Tax=Rhodoferax sp. TaxID=50421 RepID=UPI00260F6D85|nr:ChbG/HpnK family deacetylase [Rhodoferax sp.]MDD5332314.1 ChbG/HpnK family deacetylase [Rhodoferax sp.]
MISGGPVAGKGVILCADDFAVHAGASLGIAALARQGRLSASSVMVLSPRWPQDVGLLRALPQAIDVGLHLDWTSEFAVASGHGLSLPAAMLKAMLGGFARGAGARLTRSVIERQLDLFEAHWKAPPDYVDGHQHVQQFAGIREALVAALVSRYAGRGSSSPLPYLRISRAPPGQADLKSRVIAALGAEPLEQLAAQAGIHGAGSLSGIYDFAGDEARYGRLMAHWLAGAPERSIIMCHPAQTAPADDAIGAARAREFAYLGGSDFPAALAQAGVRLVRGVAAQS